jgi:hypothetical protein
MVATELRYGIDDGRNNQLLRQGTGSRKYRCVQATKVDDGGGSTMERMTKFLND